MNKSDMIIELLNSTKLSSRLIARQTNSSVQLVRKLKKEMNKPVLPAKYALNLVIRNHIMTVLILNKGNKTHTARDLDISLRTLRTKVQLYHKQIAAEVND